MSLQESLIKLDDAACAKTNIIDIQGNTKNNIERLLTTNIGNFSIAYCSRSFGKEKREKTADFEKRIHREIKIIIRTDLGLPNESQPEYESVSFWINGQKIVYFFYLSNTKSNVDELLRSIENDALKKYEKIFEALVGLHLKMEFINQTSKEYEIDPVYFNSELYLAAEFQHQPTVAGAAKIDALSPKLYFSEQNELVIKIHQKTFQTQSSNNESNDIRAEIDGTQLLFRNKKSNYLANDELNATQFSKKVFITFNEGYSQCINHAQNFVSDILKSILEKAGVSFTERYFQADYALDDFIKADKQTQKPLIIIDNLDKSTSDDERQALHRQLREEFKAIGIITSGAAPTLESLSSEKSYLVLNSTSARNGSSVVINGKSKNTFWDALTHFQKHGGEGLDYYSRLKTSWFSSSSSLIIQGLNIDRLTQNKTDKNTGEISAVFKPISVHIINRIKTELWLKERIFSDKFIEEVKLPDCQLTLVYVRIQGRGKYKKTYASIVGISIFNKTLSINSQKTLSSEQRLRSQCSFLAKRTLYNDSFCIFDEANNNLLITYNSDRVPRIIGNQQIDSLKVSEKNNDKVRRVSKKKDTILPYYLLPLERKQYHHIYLQQQEHDLLYFVSKINKPKPKIEKQSLIYNIRTFNKNGNILNSLDQAVTEIYLKSFTENILKLNEVSKSSLLEKIAKIYITN